MVSFGVQFDLVFDYMSTWSSKHFAWVLPCLLWVLLCICPKERIDDLLSPKYDLHVAGGSVNKLEDGRERTFAPLPGIPTVQTTPAAQIRGATVVLTSAGRLDLLQKTLESFQQHNTYPTQGILIEDSGKQGIVDFAHDLVDFTLNII